MIEPIIDVANHVDQIIFYLVFIWFLFKLCSIGMRMIKFPEVTPDSSIRNLSLF